LLLTCCYFLCVLCAVGILLFDKLFSQFLAAVMLFPYVRFRNAAMMEQSPLDDMMDRVQWAWQVGDC
jgi:hypothetical protein